MEPSNLNSRRVRLSIITKHLQLGGGPLTKATQVLVNLGVKLLRNVLHRRGEEISPMRTKGKGGILSPS